MKHALILILAALAAQAQYVTSLAPQFEQQFHDNSGNPLAGGSVTTYQAGTTTPLATYTNNTLSTANANPVVLDSAGRANIWLLPQAYKFVLKNSAGTTIKTVDNVIDIGMALKRDLADTSSDSLNSAMIGFKPPGGSARTVRQELITLGQAYGFLATSYGATGDGTTDDTSAIQDCIDAAAAVKGTCYLPPGTYGITDPLLIRTDTTLRGATRTATILKSLAGWNKAVGDALIKNDNTYSWGSRISDMTIQGHATTGPDYGIYYYAGNLVIFNDLLVHQLKLDGIFLDKHVTPGVLNQWAYLNRVFVWDVIQNTGLGARHGALHVNWTDVYITDSGFYGSGAADNSYTESGNRVACFFDTNSANAHMVNSECSHTETGLVNMAQNSKFTNSRVQFIGGHGVVNEVGGFYPNFAAFQVQFVGQSSGTFYGFYVKSSGGTYTGTTLINSCPSNGCASLAFRFEVSQPGLPNYVFGHSGDGSAGKYTASDDNTVVWNQNDRLSRLVDGIGGVYVSDGNGRPSAPSSGLSTRVTGGNDTKLNIGGQLMTVSAATAANPMVLTLSASAPDSWAVGSIIGISGATRTAATFVENTVDPCAIMNQWLEVTAISGASVTVDYDNSGCTYLANSAKAFLQPEDSLFVDRAGDATNGRVAGLALRGRVAQITMEDKRALPHGSDNSKFRLYTNYDEATQLFSQWIMEGVSDDGLSYERYITMNRDPAGLAAFYTAIQPDSGYAVVGDAIGDGSSGRGVFQVFGGTQQMGGLTHANLGTPGNGRFTWCTDCNVATPCTSGGAGAWAFRSGGAWKCPF